MPNAMLRKVPLLVSVALVVCGCHGDTVAPGTNDAAHTFGALRLDEHAITMAVAPPHNTIQLHATRLSQAGTPLPDSGTVQYRVAQGDTSVSVNSAGVVTAKVSSYGSLLSSSSPFVGSSAFVIASLTVQGITRVDTAVVVVTATEPDAPLATFSIHPPAESLSVYMSGRWLNTSDGAILDLIQLDSHGDTIPNQLVYFRSSNMSVAFPYAERGGFYGRGVRGIVANDTVTFSAQTWYYGVTRSDSLQVRVGFPSLGNLHTYEHTLFGSVTPELYWGPQNLELSAPAEGDVFQWLIHTSCRYGVR